MDPVTLVAGITALVSLIQTAGAAYAKLQSGQDVTPEEQDALRAVQSAADADFDDAVAEARKAAGK